jgi:hypothetical protein
LGLSRQNVAVHEVECRSDSYEPIQLAAGVPQISVERMLPVTHPSPVCERTSASSCASNAATRAGSMRSGEKPLREWNDVTYAANGCEKPAP